MKRQHKRWSLLLPITLLILLLAGLGQAALAQSGGGFNLSWHVVSGGGGPATSSGFQLNGTVGQPGVNAGLLTDGSTQVGPGFWYGIGGEHKVYLPLMLRSH